MAISRISNGGGFAGVLSYVSEKANTEFITKGGVFHDDAKAIAGEMRANADQRRLKTPVFHVSLALKPGERATTEQWKIAAPAYLEKMGFDLDRTQFVVYRHTDTEHDHIHIIASRVMLDGEVVKDGQQYKRSHEATRAAEKAAGLNSYENTAMPQKQGRMHDLRTAVDSALVGGASLAEFKVKLAHKGIVVQENRASTGRLSGLSFANTDGRVWKGSALGKEYSLAGLEKRGLETGRQQDQQHSTQENGADQALTGSHASKPNTGPELVTFGMAGAGKGGQQPGGKGLMGNRNHQNNLDDDDEKDRDDEFEY